jgi:hypothetical protein
VPSFADATLKIERAKKHIRDIEKRISGLEDSYSAVIDIHPKFGYKCIKYDFADKVAVKDISLLIGDALHNLKCALDYGWIIVLERHAPSAIGTKTQFPAHPSRDALQDALTRTKIDVLCASLFALMLTQIKPYPGGNNAIWAVKELNILDKHRLLLPLITYAGIDGLEMEDERGELRKGSGSQTLDLPPWYVRIPEGWHVKNKGKPSVAILFDEGTSAHHLNAASFLEMYSIIVLQVVKTLEGF